MQNDGTMRRLEPTREELLLHLKTEISTRIRRVCERMPQQEFDDLVGKMAELELRYRARDHK